MLTPVAHSKVRFNDKFWAPRMAINRKVTLPVEYENMERTGHIGAWTWEPGQPKTPHIFWDSDLAKWIEAVAYSLADKRRAKLEKKVDDAVALMEEAQAADGYLNSHFLKVEPEKRWWNIRDKHELYCAGHLIEAAVAYFKATGKRRLLDIMLRYVDYIARVFGTGKGQTRGYCGHPEIELALIRLYKVTGDRKHLDLARYFVDQRGTIPNFFREEGRKNGEKKPFDLVPMVDHLPLRKQSEAAGHAVRAGYIYSAMVDVAMETGDKELMDACRKIWRSIAERQMYVIGGVGSSRFQERFTFDYDLPNEEAYAETCANVALMFFTHRLLQSEPDGKYTDVIERALYNGILSGVSLDGKKFFYDNRLASHPEYYRYHEQKEPFRKEWFGCACCPPNIARVLASLGGYVYSQGKDEVFVHLYVQGEAEIDVGGGKIVIRQSTNYPWDGRVMISVEPRRPVQFALALRIPGWCRKAALKVNGKAVRVESVTRKGYARIEREWAKGDRVALELAMPVELIEAHPAVRHDAGMVAIQRGPIVYCLEEVDNGANLADIRLARRPGLKARFDARLLGGVTAITGAGVRRDTANWRNQLYRPVGLSKEKTMRIKAIPYYAWNNRGVGEMIVWIRPE